MVTIFAKEFMNTLSELCYEATFAKIEIYSWIPLMQLCMEIVLRLT